MFRTPILLLFTILSIGVLGQTYVFQGQVFDSQSSEGLSGAHLYFFESKKGVITDLQGRFSVELTRETDSVFISFLGYQSKTQILQQSINAKIELLKEDNVLEEAVVEVGFNPIHNTQSGEVKFSSEDIESLPLILGEKDIIKTLQYVPGVQSGKEGQTGMFIRGGNSSMNLFFIDDIYIHNISHLGGFFSAINSDIVSSLSFIRSGIPAYYGGKLSSVTSIETSAKTDSLEIKGALGTISSQLGIHLPIHKLNTNIQISGRRTYFDLIQPLFISSDETSILNSNTKTFFYDGFIKAETKINNKNRLSLLYYRTKDNFRDINEKNKRLMSWGNDIYGMEWKHIFSQNFFSKIKLSNSNYNFNFEGQEFPYDYSIVSKINISSFKNSYTFLKKSHKITFGLEYNYTQNLPKKVAASINNEPLSFLNPSSINTHNACIFLGDEFELGSKVKTYIGLRVSSFFHVGEYNHLSSQTEYKEGELVKSFYGLEPRVNLNYLINSNTSLKVSYHRIFQYFHQATLSTLSLPLDFVYPSSIDASPQESNQFTLGLNKQIETTDIGVEAYYNHINNLSEFRNGSINNTFNDNIYQDIIFGTAQSIGIEFFIKRKVGKLDGIISYALSKSISKFDDLNGGETFPSTFDRPHNLNCLVNYSLSDRWSFSATFILTSGQNFTAPSDIRIINETPVINYSNKNSMRYPNYHRADISITYHFKTKHIKDSNLNLTIYNVYNNKNTFFINYQVSGGYEQQSIQITPKVNTLFPFLPTLTWRIKF